MHDAVKLESAGIPAAVIVLEGFKELAYTKRRQMGLEELDPIIVTHVQGSREKFHGLGDEAIDDVASWLTRGTLASAPAKKAAAGASR